jgi:glycerol-3-phosphate dehydrogenase
MWAKEQRVLFVLQCNISLLDRDLTYTECNRNPEGIGKWLERKCTAMSVEIKTSTTAVATILSDCGAIKGLKCASAKTSNRYIFPCQKLVLAAGPWAPS